MPPRLKERYNAKARQSGVGGSSHKKRRKVKITHRVDKEGEEDESNAILIDPKVESAKKEAEKQRRELLALQDPSLTSAPISSKKRKRLDAYISRQLKKENRQKLMTDLAQSSAQVSDRSALMTSATLGTGKSLTGSERLGKEEAKEGRIQTKKRGLHFRVIEENSSELSDELEASDEEQTKEGGMRHIEKARERQIPLPVHSNNSEDDKGKALLKENGPNERGKDGAMLRASNYIPPERVTMEAEGLNSSNQEEKDSEGEEESSEEDSEEDSKEDSEEDSEEGSEEDSDEESDEESDKEEIAIKQSSRRGLATTGKSLGFKDWAREALGLAKGSEKKDSDQDDIYIGPEPVGGLSVKVKDLMDGKIRGPLGEDEPAMHERSAFAQKHYQELEKRAAKSGKDGKINKDRVAIHRLDEIEETRLMLPVLAEEERIVRTIMENMVTVLCGETGSGKTTQVPQFLYEAGFGTEGSCNPGMIGITQPRRVAALSMASRVGKELNLPSSKVSHQIRYDATVSASTSIKFMTDGVLLRELATDFLLTRYSAIIIDEAHERSVNTDVLIGVLSRVVKLRAKRWIEGQGRPLRIVIMSATLRVEDFVGNTRLFDVKPPVIEIDARQYPVVNHFSRRTTHDYIQESIKKASKIHARLPPGGILIFLTGQAEISTVCRKLEKRYGRKTLKEKAQLRNRKREEDGNEEEIEEDEKVIVAARNGDVEAEEIDLTLQEDMDLALDVDDGRDGDQNDAEALDTDEEEEQQDYDADLPQELQDDSNTPMHILPLYSLLPSDRQMMVFEAPPSDSRLVVVATNVAETSLTIPGITYVIDCGRSKERRYDAKTGVQSFQVGFISKASANQRAGRAGRTAPGHCYRLYSSNVYEEHFASFAEAEIVRIPVDNLVLMMKAMNIDNVANFPFPTPPDREALKRAEKLLLRLGALEVDVKALGKGSGYKVTELGKLMSLFPLNSRLSKLLVQGHQFDCLPYVIALVAALSVGRPFVQEESIHESHESQIEDGAKEEEEELDMPTESQYTHNLTQIDKEKRSARRAAYFKVLNQLAALSGALSDPLQLLNAVGAYEHAGGTLQFCRDNYLLPKAMQEIHKLRAQLSSMVQANAEPGIDWSHLSNPKFRSPPTSKQMTILRQFITAAFIDQVAIRADLAPEGAARIPMLQETTTSDHGYRIAKQFQHQLRNGAKMKSTRDVAYLAMGIPAEACFIHRSSVLFHQAPPEWIVFSEVFRGHPQGDTLELPGKVWLKGVTKINPNWIHKLGKPLCSFGKTVDVDQKSTRAKLIEAADEIKRRQNKSSSALNNQKQVFVVPTYGNGPACDIDERSSHVGWELPPVMANQRLIAGRWVTELT